MGIYDKDSTVGINSRETRTTADVFNATYKAPSSFDLPINDITTLVNDLFINQIGIKVLVDGEVEFIMTSDLKKRYSNLQNNMKDATFLHSTVAKRGSIVTFPNNTKAIVYDIPNDDIATYSGRIVIFNNNLDFFHPTVEYDENPKSKTYGDELHFMLVLNKSIPVFIEKIDGSLRNQDVGLLHDSIYRVIGSQELITANVEDVVMINDKYYEISDVDKLTSGIAILQLRTTRDNYDKYIIK